MLSGLYGIAGTLADGILGGNVASSIINEIAPVRTSTPKTVTVPPAVAATAPDGNRTPSWFKRNWAAVVGGGAALVAVVGIAAVVLKRKG
jgi:hypothetical protein